MKESPLDEFTQHMWAHITHTCYFEIVKLSSLDREDISEYSIPGTFQAQQQCLICSWDVATVALLLMVCN